MTEDNRIPELWWTPRGREVWWRPDPTSVSAGILTLADEGTPFDALPDDAVQLVPDRSITDLEQELYNRAVTAESERDERQARIDRALEWWRQERDADHGWPLSLEESAKVNSLRYRVYAALTGQPLAEQPLPAEEPAPLSGVALRDVEERDDAAGDLP